MTTRLIALLAVAVALTACSKDAGEGEAKAEAVVGARTAIVTTQPFTESIGAIGTVAGRAGHMATLTAPASARITSVQVSVGQHVTTGTTLIVFDPSTFAPAAAAADAALTSAQRAYERTQRLVNEGISPRKDLDQASADLAKARADAAVARRQEQLSVLRSPIAGVVTSVNATIGATADPTTRLVEIADPSALDLFFNVTPAQAAEIRRGAKIQLSAGQSSDGEPLGVATVVDVGGTVDSATRSVVVRAQAPTTRRPLRIGETVFGQVGVATRPNAVVIPSEALVPEGEEFKVFVVDAGGIAHARPVKVGGRSDKLVEITEGLKAGERIVTYGAYGVDDSVKVAPLGGTPAVAK
ncbi:MAG: efflux transporter, family, subunit [Gemmatimonadetes bacterium]|nr:efflux transporter, family, subunit [Gemmatimonadota bacterium]